MGRVLEPCCGESNGLGSIFAKLRKADWFQRRWVTLPLEWQIDSSHWSRANRGKKLEPAFDLKQYLTLLSK